MLFSVFDRAENIVGKGENAGYHNVLKGFFQRHIKRCHCVGMGCALEFSRILNKVMLKVALNTKINSTSPRELSPTIMGSDRNIFVKTALRKNKPLEVHFTSFSLPAFLLKPSIYF